MPDVNGIRNVAYVFIYSSELSKNSILISRTHGKDSIESMSPICMQFYFVYRSLLQLNSAAVCQDYRTIVKYDDTKLENSLAENFCKIYFNVTTHTCETSHCPIQRKLLILK